MSAKSNNFKLGLFTLLAVILLILAVIILGSGSLMKPKLLMETYFDASVQGINVGSKVKFRGVTIGEITAIDFTNSRYQTNRTYVLVEMAVTKSLSEKTVSINTEVEKGLRASMSAQGITGVYFIELDFVDPNRSPILPIDWTPGRAYIPSAGTSFQNIMNSLEKSLDHIQKINFAQFIDSTEKFANSASSLAASANATLSQFPMKKIGDDTGALITELRASNQRLQQILDNPNTENALNNLAAAAGSLRRQLDSPQLADTLAKLNTAANQADQLLSGKDTQIDILLENLRKAAGNLRDFTEDIEQNPSRLLRGGQPPKEK